jgi:hypothetical protein
MVKTKVISCKAGNKYFLADYVDTIPLLYMDDYQFFSGISVDLYGWGFISATTGELNIFKLNM